MTDRRMTDPEAVKAMIASHKLWYHRIELAPGIVTPGSHDSPAAFRHLEAMGLPADCRGLRVLDIGCRDGFFAFEMEKRGAEVVGIDYAEPDITGFSTAAKVLASRVTYVVENVYNLTPEKLGRFDIVFFLGVVYHLRNPMLALDRIRTVTRPGGLLYVESLLAPDAGVNESKVALWQFLPKDSFVGDATSKWAPNIEGLKMAVEESEFEALGEAVRDGRGWVKARAIVNRDREFFRRLDSEAGLRGKAVNTPTKMVPDEGYIKDKPEIRNPKSD
jgi:tRNA (mo5U34)-methyltransferase